jgi:hypothetical protein
MRNWWIPCLLLAGLANGQSVPPPMPRPHPSAAMQGAPKEDAALKEAQAKIAPGDSVITVKGACSDPAKKGETCETVVTREQFEKLAEALQPNMATPIKLRLATAYSRLIGMSQEATKRGLDKSPKFEANLAFARMQILSQQLTSALQEDSQKVSDEDIEKYYKEKADTYQEYNLQRLYVPRTKQIVQPKTVAGAKKDKEAEERAEKARIKVGEEAMTKTAAALRARAAKGEAFDALEKEAYLAAGLKGNPPSTKMEKMRPTALPPAHHAALELKPGDVSAVISDTTGHYIYKLVSKQTLPLESVKPEIKNWIASQRFRDAMQEFQGTSQLNDAYFGIAPKPPAKPGSEPDADVDPD